MARKGKPTRARRKRRAAAAQAPARVPRKLVVVAVLALASALVATALVWRAVEEEVGPVTARAPVDPGPVHVHGLGVNPRDGALYVATHAGLYKAPDGERTARRVGDRLQDTMGFTVVGPDRFLGSGHPDAAGAKAGLPPLLGLIASTDAGRTWQPVSLQGEADFHVLRSAGARVYGYDAANGRLLVSADRGRSWSELAKPGPIVDLAVAPATPDRIVAASAGELEQGLFESRDGGRSWRRTSSAVGLLAWPAPDRLYLVVGGGEVYASSDGGRTLEARGEIGGEPAAFLGEGEMLYVALHDGTIKRSVDGGTTWQLRSAA